MLNMFEQHSDTGKWNMKSGFGSFAVPLLELQGKGKILVIEPGNDVANFAASEGHDVTHIDTSLPIEDQVAMIQKSAPYNGAIIIPVFGLSVGRDPKLAEWSLGKMYAEDMLLVYALKYIGEDGSLVALVSRGLLTGYSRATFRRKLIDSGLSTVVSIPTDVLFGLSAQIQVGLITVRRQYANLGQPITFLDLEHFAEFPRVDYLLELIHGVKQTEIAGELMRVDVQALSNDCRLDPQFYDPAYLQIKPPTGFLDYALEEIAEIRGGIGRYGARDRFENDPGNGIPYCQVRHILDDGTFADDLMWIKQKPESGDETGWATPGDVLVTVAGTVGKVAVVPPRFVHGLFFDTSLRRVRVVPEYATPQVVCDFLRSDLGQLQFRRLTSGTVIPQLTSAALGAIRVFLPPPEGQQVESATSAPVEVLTEAGVIAAALQTQVVDYLRQVPPDDTKWQSHIRTLLQEFINTSTPKSLEEAVLSEFPAPLAIPYRRYKSSRFNSYEQLDRLIALVNACTYFTYHVLLSDYCRNDWQIKFSSDARAALNGDDSIDHRLKFIEEAFQAVRQGTVVTFMPELADTSVVSVGDLIRLNVRNPTAHSAPAAEPRVKALIAKYRQPVEDLLNELRFLSRYRLCQIRHSSYHDGQWLYQSEIYKGAEYDVYVDELQISPDSDQNPRFIQAERDHLVILNADFETLDLFPFYQVHFSEATGLEPHLCFFKKAFKKELKLLGESVRSGIEVTLEGYDEFRRLVDSSGTKSSTAEQA